MTAVLDRLLAQQHGVVTRAQALAAGLSVGTIRRHVGAGRWQPLGRGVFAAFSGPVPRLSQLWAVVLAAGQDALLSYETAAELVGLAPESRHVHVTVPVGRTVRGMSGVVIHRSSRAVAARHPVRQPPQTRVEETVIDLAQSAHNLEDAYGFLARAVNNRLTTVDRLREAIAARAKVRWRRLLLEGLGDVAAGCRSVLELAYLRRVERAHGLPPGQRQDVGTDGRIRIDVRYRRYRVRVELDGRAAHPFDHRFRDMRRDNHAVVVGDETLRYGTADITQRCCEVAREVGGVLMRAGWPAKPVSCGAESCVIP